MIGGLIGNIEIDISGNGSGFDPQCRFVLHPVIDRDAKVLVLIRVDLRRYRLSIQQRDDRSVCGRDDGVLCLRPIRSGHGDKETAQIIGALGGGVCIDRRVVDEHTFDARTSLVIVKLKGALVVRIWDHLTCPSGNTMMLS